MMGEKITQAHNISSTMPVSICASSSTSPSSLGSLRGSLSKRLSLNSPPAFLGNSIPENEELDLSPTSSSMITNSPASSSKMSFFNTSIDQPKSIVINLEDEPWFWGDISREEVNERMLGAQDGSFLVRNSTTFGDYTLTLRKDGANKLIKIYQKDSKFGFSMTEELRFNTVSELVQFYRGHSLKEYNRNLDITLSNPMIRSGLDQDDDLMRSNIDDLSTKLRQTHKEYLKRSREYDCAYEDYSRINHEVQVKRQAMAAFNETLAMFHEQIALHKKFKEEAQFHEQSRLRENFEILQNRCNSLCEHKTKLDEDLQKAANHLRHLEREINSYQPELIRLHRHRERYQRVLQRRGVQASVVQKMLHDLNVMDDMKLGNSMDQASATATAAYNGQSQSSVVDRLIGALNNDYDRALNALAAVNTTSTISRTGDYIPPLSVIKESKNWLLTDVTKSEGLQMLQNQKDGAFLIRPSESLKGKFALSVVCKGQTHSCLIESMDGNPSGGSLFAFAGTDAWFNSLIDLVAHYSYNSLKDHNPELDTPLTRPIVWELEQQRQQHQ